MMLAILLGCFGFASLCFLLLPLICKTSPARDSFDEQNHRKTLYRDQVSELREGLGDEALLPELEDELGITYNSIMDKYSIRKLGVKGSKEFDSLVHMFLNNNDMALRNRCLSVSKKNVDDDAIRSFFNGFF